MQIKNEGQMGKPGLSVGTFLGILMLGFGAALALGVGKTSLGDMLKKAKGAVRPEM